jgi:hypothetical protein
MYKDKLNLAAQKGCGYSDGDEVSKLEMWCGTDGGMVAQMDMWWLRGDVVAQIEIWCGSDGDVVTQIEMCWLRRRFGSSEGMLLLRWRFGEAGWR